MDARRTTDATPMSSGAPTGSTSRYARLRRSARSTPPTRSTPASNGRRPDDLTRPSENHRSSTGVSTGTPPCTPPSRSTTPLPSTTTLRVRHRPDRREATHPVGVDPADVRVPSPVHRDDPAGGPREGADPGGRNPNSCVPTGAPGVAVSTHTPASPLTDGTEGVRPHTHHRYPNPERSRSKLMMG